MSDIIKDFVELTAYEVEEIDKNFSPDDIAKRYLELLEEYKKGGPFPVVVSVDDILLEKFEIDLEDEGLEVSSDNFKKIVEAYLEAAEKIKVEDVISSESKAQILEDLEVNNLKKIDESYDLELLSIVDYEDGLKEDLLIVKLPITKPYEVFAYLPMGGFNDCPLPAEMVAVSKYWYEKHGAVPSALSYDEVEYYIEKRTTDEELIKELAAEHCLYDVDIVDQCVGSLEKLAECFYDNNQWYFWWD